MSIVLTREKLYELVWSEPLRTLSKRFGISHVALAKRCRAAHIPLPSLGYWSRKEAGKWVTQLPLPSRALGQHHQLVIGPKEPFRPEGEDALLTATIAPPPEFPEDFEQVMERARQQVGKVRAPSLSRPHPVIARLLKDDQNRLARRAASLFPSALDTPLFDNPFEKRRLRILNAICLSLARAGCACSARGKEGDELSLTVGDQRLHFNVGPVKKPPYTYPPKPLALATPLKVEVSWYDAPSELMLLWQDDKDGALEDKLEDIVVRLVAYGEWSYRRTLRWHYEMRVAQQRELQERRHKAIEEAARKEKERLEKEGAGRLTALLNEAANWRRAAGIRAYVAARLDAAAAAEGAHRDETEQWAQWALAEADAVDPLLRPLTSQPRQGN